MTMTESAALFIREFGLQGTPEQVAENPVSYTGQYVKKYLNLGAEDTKQE